MPIFLSVDAFSNCTINRDEILITLLADFKHAGFLTQRI